MRDQPQRHSQDDQLSSLHPSRRTQAPIFAAMSSISGTPRDNTPAVKRRRTDSGDDSPTRRESDGGEGRRTDGGDTRDASLTPRRSPGQAKSRYRSRSGGSSRSSSRRRPRSYSDSRSQSHSSDRTRTDTSPSPAPQAQRQNTPPRPSLRPNYRPKLALHGHTKPVSQVRISPDGRFIASSSADATIKIWDAATGQHMDTLVGHMAGVSCVAWGPDSNTLASGADDKAIRLWDRVTGRPKTTARRMVHGQEMPPLRGHHNYIHCLAFSPKGNILASGSYDEAVFLWDVRAGRLMRSLPAHSDPVSGIDFCRDGTLVASCSTDGLIRIWDTSTGQCLRTLVHEDNPAVANVCFSPNGRYVLAFNLDNCIRLWDYVSGSVKKTYQGHRNEKFAVGGCFATLDGQPFIAAASEDGGVVLWDVVSKDVLQRVEGHKEGVCFWVDVHGDTMVTAGQDSVIRVYRHKRSGGEKGGSNGAVNGDAKQLDLPIRQEDVKMEDV